MVVLANVCKDLKLKIIHMFNQLLFFYLENLNTIKKKFSFLNPSWAALKYFDEQQFLRIVQGQGSINSSHVLGRLPRKLNLPIDHNIPSLHHSRSKSQTNIKSAGQTPSAYSTVSSRVSNITRKSSFTGSASLSSLRQRSSSQSQSSSQQRSINQHEKTTNIRLDALKHHNSHSSHNSHHKAVSSPSLLKNRHVQQNTSFLSRSGNDSSSSTTDATSQVNTLEGLLFEHFTYGGEEIQLFDKSNPPSASCSSPASPIYKRTATKKDDDDDMQSYNQDFQLSPPPAKRRASLTTSFNSMSFCNAGQQNSVKLTRSPSFSSIII